MDWRTYLFSFDGRINRAKYWLFVLVGLLFVAVMVAIAMPYILIARRTAGAPMGGFTPLLIVTIVVEFVVLLAYLVAGFAIAIKRLHDRNKSGWWSIVFLVLPSVFNLIGRAAGGPGGGGALFELVGLGLSVWAFVELGCLRGTDGTNDYGPDPLGGGGNEAEVFT